MKTSVTAFLEKVGTTPELQEKLAALYHEAEPHLIKGLVRISAEAGFTISAEEWTAACSATGTESLSEKELAGISGGFKFPKIELQPVTLDHPKRSS